MHRDSYEMYLEEISMVHACTEAEARALLEQIRNGEAGAKERLLEGMLPFTAEIAGEYKDQGVPVGDLVQEANLALLITADAYRTDAYQEESSAAGSFHEKVREQAAAMIEALLEEHRQQKHVEEELVARINVLQKVSKVLAEELDREPTVTELADKMKMTEDEIRMIMKETLNAMSVSPDAEV